MRKISTTIFAFCMITMKAQDTPKASPLTFSGYVEPYYSYDVSQPDNHERPSFFYCYNRHNEVNLNLGFVKANYAKDEVRANFALMAGTYAQYNLSGEAALLRHVFEANVGVKVSKKHNLWLDTGIMPSHIGFESAIGKDCATLSRSLLAENSPYFEAGVKLSLTTANEKWYAALLYLNGWQRIQRVTGNQSPAFGTQLTYKPNTKTTFNWSTYVGNELPFGEVAWRIFNNFYVQHQANKKLALTAGFDIGLQEEFPSIYQRFNAWYSPVVIARYNTSLKTRLAARVEYYSDKYQVVISTNSPNGFQVLGFSVNFDYIPAENVMLRFEVRNLNSKDDIFVSGSDSRKQNVFFTTSAAVSF